MRNIREKLMKYQIREDTKPKACSKENKTKGNKENK